MSRQGLNTSGLNNRFSLLGAMFRDAALGAGLWYAVVKISWVMGLPHSSPPSGWVACGVVAILLPASWCARASSPAPLAKAK